SNLKSFTFNDLKNATRNFRADSLLGEGGFGYVFKGWIDETTFAPCKPGSGMVVAVKKLKPESFQGHREWLVCHLTPKNDVYSFGVVLLELLSGKRATGDENAGGADEKLVEWAKPFLSDSRRVLRIMDIRLGGQYSKKGAQTAASLVLRCLDVDPKLRPTMDEVLATLQLVQAPKDVMKSTQQIKQSR
uniref:Protein kinase APK1A, chloroplast n=1 Tax=Solanum tuberosum TaxID=4113 RepID=M1C2N2_SOLTU